MDFAQAKRDERWTRVETAFAAGVELDASARDEYLTTSCPDPDVRREVERLLSAHDAAGDFLHILDRAKSAALLTATSEAEPTPDVIGRYRIVRRLGSGAMGIVYLAHDGQLDRPVALKLLRPRGIVSGSAQRQLLEEARAASALDHPNVAAIYEVGETGDGRPFIAMAYCEGETLATRIARGHLTVHEATSIGHQIAQALAAAHAFGIVHRDVKPANIVVSVDGRVRLMDFGVAIVTGREGGQVTVAGTPAYMSPEQVLGEPGQPASDVWALGVVLYEMLTARRPFPIGSVAELARAIQQPPDPIRRVRPDIPRALGNIVDRCLTTDPALRPGSATVAGELRPFAQAEKRAQWRTRPVRLLLAGAGAVILAALLTFVPRARRTGNAASAAEPSLVVLPFTPVTPDTALERVGRELAVTLSASLDQTPGLRVVDPITVLGPRSVDATTPGARADLARRMGAGSVLSGQVSRAPNGLRLDAAIHGTLDGSLIARASVEAPGDHIGAITDSLTLALLRTAWKGRLGPAPNLAAITTASLPALRAYLEGELAVAAGRLRSAPDAFARAIREDSTFWFAYWRYWYARSWHGSPVDSAIISAVVAHRAEFPEPDRLLVEARLASGERAKLALRRTITERHPLYWPAWFELGNQLLHHGPFIGMSTVEAITALKRTVALNPNIIPAWEQIFWASLLQRDSAETGRILAHFDSVRLDTLLLDKWDHRPLDYYRYLDHLLRSGDVPREADAEIGARVLAEVSLSVDPERSVATISSYGFFRGQLDLSRRVLLLRPRPAVGAAHIWGAALAWAGRGAWDSAFVNTRHYVRMGSNPMGALRAYGLVTTLAWLGVLPNDSAATLREAAQRSQGGRAPEGMAELAWLDGLLACSRGDAQGLRRERAILGASAAPAAPTLARSLGAFDAALSGRTAAAGRLLAALEWENADHDWQWRYGPEHPFVVGVNRLAALRWLLAAGDTAEATALALLHEPDLPSWLNPFPIISFVLGNFTLPALARVEEARGRAALASRYRAAFRARVDRNGSGDDLLGPCLRRTLPR